MQAPRTPYLVCGHVLAAALLLAGTAAQATAGDRGGARRTGNYLVITAGTYANSTPLNDFIAAKTAQGFTVSTYEVPTGTSRTAIKSYIENLWGTEDAPDYILLVGDATSSSSTSTMLPYWTGGGSKACATDLPYGCMDSGDDWYPDIAVGRFAVRDVDTLADVVEKSLFVEAGEYPDEEYYLRGAFLANPSTNGMAEPTHDWVIENYFTPNGYEGVRLYSSEGADTQDVTDAINDGCLWAVYYGHSSSSGWWDPSYDQGDVRGLSNAGLYGVVFSFSCNVGAYHESECFGETWLREADKGAAAVIMPSYYIYWGSQEAWMPSTVLEQSFFRAFFEDDIWEVAPAWQAGLYHFLEDYDGSEDIKRNFFELYNVLGDPALLLPGGQSFELATVEEYQNLCSPPEDEATFTVNVLANGNFDEVVTLAAGGVPSGAIVDFSVNAQVPPFTSIMTLSNLTSGSPGTYRIEISGESESMEVYCFVDLNLADGMPGSVELLSPPDGEEDLGLTPTLTWDPAGQAVEYEIEIATDAGFTDVVYSATAQGTTHTLTSPLQRDATYYWHVCGSNGCGSGEFSSTFSFATYVFADYFTEQFTVGIDLAYSSVSFTPDGSGDYYMVCRADITELPTEPVGGLTIHLPEDGFGEIDFTGGSFPLYGTEYSSYFVGSNGYITFGQGDDDGSESLSDHFDLPRISGLFDNLTPNDGIVRCQQFSDRAVVTYEEVPEYGTSNSNTFQIEMFYDGMVRIAWLEIEASDAIVGLSQGEGVPSDFEQTDLSAVEFCEPDCPGDLDGDSDVDLADLSQLLANYGTTEGAAYEDGDLDGDGDVDLTDLSALLAVYGTTCE